MSSLHDLREKNTIVVAQLKQLQAEIEPIVKMHEDKNLQGKCSQPGMAGYFSTAWLKTGVFIYIYLFF